MTDYSNVPILDAFGMMLRDAFVADGDPDVFLWIDGRTFNDLVGIDVAQQFHDRPKEDFEFLRSVGQDFLQVEINHNQEKPAILVEFKGSQPVPHCEIWFWVYDRDQKTWIDPAMNPPGVTR